MNRRAWLLVLPMVGAIFCYWRAVRCDFVFDDQSSVVQDPAARSLAVSSHALVPSLLSAGHSPAATTVAENHGRIRRSAGLEGGRGFVAWTLAINHAIGGLHPFGYHVANLVFHLLAALLVFFFTLVLLRRAGVLHPDGGAAVVAGIFVLHPLNSQAVNYVTQRAEVIASAAYLGALLLVLRASSARRVQAAVLLLLALAVFALGLGTKVIVVTMPVAYLLVVLVVPDRRPGVLRPGWPRHMLLVAPFLFLAAWKARALLASVKGHSDAGFDVDVAGLNAWTYFMTEWKVVLIYLRLLFWPSGQNLDWRYPVATGLDAGVVAAGLALLAAVGLAVGLVWRARRLAGTRAVAARVVAFGIFWYLILLAPTSSVVPLADLLVEHRPYLASVGPFIAVVALAEHFLARGMRAVFPAVVVAWAVLGVVLYRRNAAWENPRALWQDVVAKQPANGRAHTTLGRLDQERGDLAGAIREYGLALQRMSDGQVEERLAAMQAMAAAMVDAGHSREAMAVIRAALAFSPGDATTLATLAAAQLRAGELDAAEGTAQAVLATRPGHSQALLTLGEARLLRDDVASAARYLSEAVTVDPDEPIRLLTYGRALARLGRREEACRTWLAAAHSPEARDSDRDWAARLSTELGCSTARPSEASP